MKPIGGDRTARFRRQTFLWSLLVLLPAGNGAHAGPIPSTPLLLKATNPALPPGWPQNINTPNGFAELGRAIAREKEFPKNGTTVEKARYIATRLPEIAKGYGLSAGTEGLFRSRMVGAVRWFDEQLKRFGREDKENAAVLKSTGVGNCGEWSYAFSELLSAAGVQNRVVFADVSPADGHSSDFNKTDTAVLVVDQDASGKLERRIFDPFRASYHGKGLKPTPVTTKQWNDVPFTDDDLTQEQKKWGTLSWKDGLVRKPYVKDATNQKVMDLSLSDKAKKAKSFLIGKVVTEKSDEAVAGAIVRIERDNFSKGLVSQRGGEFTSELAPGDYRVVLLSQAGSEVAVATAHLKVGEKTQLTLILPAEPEEVPTYFGTWGGTGKVLKSSEPTLVGTNQPYTLEITPQGTGVSLKTERGLFGMPESYVITTDGPHLKVSYSGPDANIKFGNAGSVTLTFDLDVTAKGDALKGQLSVSSTATVLGAVQTVSHVVSLDLTRKKDSKTP